MLQQNLKTTLSAGREALYFNMEEIDINELTAAKTPKLKQI